MTQPSYSQYLLAAKRAECKALLQLTAGCDIVIAAGELIHQLQKERGLSNIYLVSDAGKFSRERQQQCQLTSEAEQGFISAIDAHSATTLAQSTNSRLLHNVAVAMQRLEGLYELRMRISTLDINAANATSAFNNLIKSLLALVFETADSARDVPLSGILVALFNLMQGKEYAGQERAWGAIGFTACHFTDEIRDHLSRLYKAQQDCFELFDRFAPVVVSDQFVQLKKASHYQKMEKLRRIASQVSNNGRATPNMSENWYHVATLHIDAVRLIEVQLIDHLRALAKARQREVRQELQSQRRFITVHPYENPPAEDTERATKAFEQMLADPRLDHFQKDEENSLYILLCQQARQLENMSERLTDTRRVLKDQKHINRAKLILMQRLSLTEDQAHHALQKQAMNDNLSVAEVAESVLKLEARR